MGNHLLDASKALDPSTDTGEQEAEINWPVSKFYQLTFEEIVIAEKQK